MITDQFTDAPAPKDGAGGTAVTRAELAEKLANVAYFTRLYSLQPERADVIDTAVALLRQSCAGCRHWNNGKGQQVGTSWRNGVGCEAGTVGRFMSERGGVGPVKLCGLPADGSGYCWQWEPKP